MLILYKISMGQPARSKKFNNIYLFISLGMILSVQNSNVQYLFSFVGFLMSMCACAILNVNNIGVRLKGYVR